MSTGFFAHPHILYSFTRWRPQLTPNEITFDAKAINSCYRTYESVRHCQCANVITRSLSVLWCPHQTGGLWVTVGGDVKIMLSCSPKDMLDILCIDTQRQRGSNHIFDQLLSINQGKMLQVWSQIYNFVCVNTSNFILFQAHCQPLYFFHSLAFLHIPL